MPQGLAWAASCYAQPFSWVVWAGDFSPSSSPRLTAGTQPGPGKGRKCLNEVFGRPYSRPGLRELKPEQNPLICTKASRVALEDSGIVGSPKPAAGDANSSVSDHALPLGKQKEKEFLCKE